MISKSIRLKSLITVAGLGIGVFPLVAFAQNCTEPAGTSFRTTTLIDVGTGNLPENLNSDGVVQMAIASDGRVFIAKMRTGQIRVYTGTAGTTTLAGTISTYFDTEDGLLGIALDPNFATNNWLYAFYSDGCGLNCTNRAMELARFTITNNQFTFANRKVILRFPRAKDDTHHAAGGLAFDQNGVLVIGTGDNTDPHDATNNGYGPVNFGRAAADAQRTASNTNDLRGKILRIKPMPFADTQTPTPGVGTTYTIPAGNLWEKISNKSFNPGWDNTDDTSKVLHEIYTFGHRNPFHPRVDSRSGWITWGEVGPDANSDDANRGPSGHDEFNLATGPGFYGHPYCNGYNVPWNMMTKASPATYGGKYNCAAPVDTSPNNTGIHHLPPSIPALAAYTSGNSTDDDPRFNAGTSLTTVQHANETAISGPMYRYDSSLVSTVKFPPYYEGKVFFFDWSRRNLRIITFNPDGTIPAGTAGVHNFAPAGYQAASYIDMQFGPDGAMYFLRATDNGYGYGSGPALYRIEYTGTYDNSCYKPFVATVGPVAVAINTKSIRRESIAPVMANGFLTLPLGYRSVELYDLAGRQVWNYHRENADLEFRVHLPANLPHGVLHAKLIP